MTLCKLCNARSSLISRELGVCLECIKGNPDEALNIAMRAHRRSRAAFGLPEEPPRDPGGAACHLCANECRIPEGGRGYCGLRGNEGGRLVGPTPEEGKLSWYRDPLPTNCVADWVCPGGTGAGYPRYAHSPGPELGYRNLAVFFHACSFNCLYCQNWRFRVETLSPRTASVNELASDIDERTSCICYFGGDPAPQLPFALKASRLSLERSRGRILRICWETNGSMSPDRLDEMIKLSFGSGGCIKFDLKAFNEDLHLALTGVSNQRTLENFRRVGEETMVRAEPPLLVASTLLVPGYADEEEVRSIARLIASINPEIPYRLLAFHPCFYLADLPLIQRAQARSCLDAAREEGLRRVSLGNLQLLV
jgi:pyruvate formate lyase activating enzyme